MDDMEKGAMKKGDVDYRETCEKIMRGELLLSFNNIPPINPLDYVQFLYEEGYLGREGMEAIVSSITILFEDSYYLDSFEFVVQLLRDIEIYRWRRFRDMPRPEENLPLIVSLMKYYMIEEKLDRR
jgi:hypothetical protein